MSGYAKCTACGEELAKIQLHYETEQDKIMNDIKATSEQRDKKLQELCKSFELKYCCNRILITYIRLEDIAKRTRF